jgi:protein-S-isoprenylcysteine O-methyltransferase Ste14/uncharacterized membrane protein (UPF0127 family)
MIRNLNSHTDFKLNIFQARTFAARLIGLLGTDAPMRDTALHITPCKSIHTLGMKYPIDVIFLDKEGFVVQLLHSVRPNSIPGTVAGVASVIELPPGSIENFPMRPGEQLSLSEIKSYRPGAAAFRNLFHWPVNIMIAVFWFQFVMKAGALAVAYPRFMNWGILIHNTLLMFFFLTRRKSSETSFRFVDWIIPILTMTATLLLRPAEPPFQHFSTLSSIWQSVGLAGIIYALLSLGRSFGVVPANRTVVIRGAYGYIRHPLYLSELLFHAGFFLGNMTLRNGVLILFILAGQLWRSLSEEKLLSADALYRDYRKRVRYRFIPGIF